MSEPTTEAGRALRRDIATETPIYEPEKAILAIEQEARRQALAEVLAAVGEDLSRAADLMKPESCSASSAASPRTRSPARISGITRCERWTRRRPTGRWCGWQRCSTTSGKPATASDGRFIGHEQVGADLARALLHRLRFPRTTQERVVLLVRQHMFDYKGTWSDAAVRRFIMRVGSHGIDELFALRAADNVGSGIPADSNGLEELRRRVHDQLEAEVVLDRADLAVNGDDLIGELGLTSGPTLGRILDSLLDRVIADPALNDRPTLLMLAQAMLTEE